MALTNDDLKKIKGLIDQSLDERNVATKQDLAQTEQRLTQKIEETREGIVQDINDYLHDELYPLLDTHEKRLKRVEKHLDIPPFPTKS